MTAKPPLSVEAAAELHNRIAREVVSRVVKEPIAAGGSLSDVLLICESVLVGVVVECFKVGHDIKVLEAIFSATKERLAKVQLEDLEAGGNG